MINIYSFLRYLILFLGLNALSLHAQDATIPAHWETAFTEAKSLLASFKNDSALLVTNQLIEELAEANLLETPFGLRVQFRQAEALEKDQQNEKALPKLLQIKKLSKEKEVWDVYANTLLILALMYEKIGRKEDCLTELRLVQRAVKKYELDSLYPLFAIRIASYFRVYKVNKDSAIYYAEEVLRTAPQYQQKEEEAVGHLLMGNLLYHDSYSKTAYHFQSAAKTFKEIEDYTGYSYLLNNLAHLHFKYNNPLAALAYNDSTLAVAHLAVAKGHEQHSAVHGGYKFRGKVYQSLGQFDSAWVNLKKGYEKELQYINRRNHEKVIEIDARYKDEQKAQQIAEQSKQLKLERQRTYLLLGIMVLILLTTSILAYFYLKLNSANKKTEEQAQIIQNSNEELSETLEQLMLLQSEVHHRVKNNLQVIISLLELQEEELTDLKAIKNLQTMSKRIYSMAAIHEILYQQEDIAAVSFADYTKNLCDHFSNFSTLDNLPEFNISMSKQFFNLETSMPLGIILTELITNSLKYAQTKGKQLRIDIGLQPTKEGYCLNYKDNGPGFPKQQLEGRKGGLGAYLLKSMSRQLSGRIVSKNEEGAMYQIFFKEKNVRASPI